MQRRNIQSFPAPGQPMTSSIYRPPTANLDLLSGYAADFLTSLNKEQLTAFLRVYFLSRMVGASMLDQRSSLALQRSGVTVDPADLRAIDTARTIPSIFWLHNSSIREQNKLYLFFCSLASANGRIREHRFGSCSKQLCCSNAHSLDERKTGFGSRVSEYGRYAGNPQRYKVRVEAHRLIIRLTASASYISSRTSV
ncbi:hypothetical protein RvY_03320-2 [Ramazzottius varieornatus]|uniref:Uncharacterized protein n=1 Tax=Ramazzottius varieornatus TaxID=947166 RepID=A0A1D1UXV1_RAMVA|nr:hypothetical protein RvY_03320-2 [Ramazzottius varieornatus]